MCPCIPKVHGQVCVINSVLNQGLIEELPDTLLSNSAIEAVKENLMGFFITPSISYKKLISQDGKH